MSLLHYHFGPFQLEPQNKCLLKEGKLIELTPKAFDILVLMMENRDRLVPRIEIHEHVWPNTFVSDHNISVYVSKLRKALGDCRIRQTHIKTVPKSGYRFIARVSACRKSHHCHTGTKGTHRMGRVTNLPLSRQLLRAIIRIIFLGF